MSYNKKIESYEILGDTNERDLVKQVLVFIEKGWQPLGRSYFVDQTEKEDESRSMWFYQTMVKYSD